MTKQPPPDDYDPLANYDWSTDTIRVDDTTKIEQLVDKLEGRLEALLAVHECDPTPEGWRELALRLVQGHLHKTAGPIVFNTPADRFEGARGPNVGKNWRLAHVISMDLHRRRRKIPKTTVKAVAKDWASRTGRAVGAIENLVKDFEAGKLHKPVTERREPYQRVIDDALDQAAQRLEEEYEAAKNRANRGHKVPD